MVAEADVSAHGRGASPMISFDHVGKRSSRRAHLSGPSGMLTSMFSPASSSVWWSRGGCGKSTLLNLTAGLMEYSSGTVLYAGEPVTSVNTKVGYVTQADTLLPWRTVRQNITIPLELRGGERSSNKGERVTEMIEKVGLGGFQDHYLAELSGGMRKQSSSLVP